MGKTARTEEEELISRIQAYRQEVSSALKNIFLAEKDQRHRQGEIFFEGYWVPEELVPRLQQELSKRARVIFFETHLLSFGIVLLNVILWFAFRIFLLP